MPNYLYKCETHGEFEVFHSIKECLECCPKCKEENLEPKKVVRLIAGNTTFVLSGGGWAKDNYS